MQIIYYRILDIVVKRFTGLKICDDIEQQIIFSNIYLCAQVFQIKVVIFRQFEKLSSEIQPVFFFEAQTNREHLQMR